MMMTLQDMLNRQQALQGVRRAAEARIADAEWDIDVWTHDTFHPSDVRERAILKATDAVRSARSVLELCDKRLMEVTEQIERLN